MKSNSETIVLLKMMKAALGNKFVNDTVTFIVLILTIFNASHLVLLLNVITNCYTKVMTPFPGERYATKTIFSVPTI